MEEEKLFYPLFKMLVGAICLILAAEYAWSYAVYHAASFGILYIGDMSTWMVAGLILLSEGLTSYLRVLSELSSSRVEVKDSPRIKIRREER